MEKHVQKMALVPHQMLTTIAHRGIEDQQPLERQISQLDFDMKTILDNTDLPADVKAKLFQDKLGKYLSAQDEKRKPLKIAVEKVKPKLPLRLPVDHSVVLKGIGAARRKFAVELLDFLEEHRGTIEWNDNLELVADGQPIVGSNLIQLVHYATRDLSTEPHGWAEFRRQLLAHGVPRTAIGSRNFDRQVRRVAALRVPLRRPARASPPHTRRGRAQQHGHGIKEKRSVPWLSVYK